MCFPRACLIPCRNHSGLGSVLSSNSNLDGSASKPFADCRANFFVAGWTTPAAIVLLLTAPVVSGWDEPDTSDKKSAASNRHYLQRLFSIFTAFPQFRPNSKEAFVWRYSGFSPLASFILSKRLGKYKTQALLNDSANRHTGIAVCVYKCALRVCRLWSFYGGA